MNNTRASSKVKILCNSIGDWILNEPMPYVQLLGNSSSKED